MANGKYTTFFYTGLKYSVRVQGTMKAASVNELQKRLAYRDVKLVSQKSLFETSGKLSIDEIIRFSSQMFSMLKNGISSAEAIQMIAEYASEDFKYILIDVLNKLNEGENLATSFRKNGFFTSLFCETVAMGEKSGNLDTAFENIKKFYESEKFIKSKVKSMMTYPCIIIGLLLIVTIIMSAFVLPKFSDVYAGMGAELPIISQVYIRFGQYITGAFWMAAIGVTLLLVLFKKYKKDLLHRKNLDRFVLTIPIIGGIQQKILVARFSNVLALYLKSGIQIQDGILSSARILQNQSVYDEFLRGIRLLLKGQTFFEIVDDITIFPPFYKQVVYTGERSGDLASSLVNLSETMNFEAQETLENSVKNINQTISIALFVMLAPTFLAILLPVFNLTTIASQAGGL